MIHMEECLAPQDAPHLHAADAMWTTALTPPPAPTRDFPRLDWSTCHFSIPCYGNNGRMDDQIAWAARKATVAVHRAREHRWQGVGPHECKLAVVDKVLELYVKCLPALPS